MKKITLAFVISIATITSIQAKWANVADAPTKHSLNVEINVNRDGTLEVIEETTQEILNDTGRNYGTNTVLYYNGDSEKMEILEAKTIAQGKEYIVDKTLLEDKPLASSPVGFDQKRQILLTFPRAEMGAKTYLKYKFTLTKPSLDNFYGQIFSFGNNQFVDSAKVKIKSKLPLYILVNDPDKYLKVIEKKDKGSHIIEITLLKPIYKTVTNEYGTVILNPKHIPYVSVSSLNSWEELAKEHGKQVGPVLAQKLPEGFEEILKKAKQKKAEIEQINTVTSLLNDKIRYMGDWRTVKGRIIPRNLNEISKTQTGDCKDFSAATAAILNKLGYTAQLAAIKRGVANTSTENILPNISVFNHAIVKVTDTKGKTYWIDPTNFESMADGIFPDIANKKALILNAKKPAYEKIPPVDYQHAETKAESTLTVLPNNKIFEKGVLTLKNETTIGLTGAELTTSKDTIKNAIFYSLANRILNENDQKNMQLPPLSSRIVKDIEIKYSFERDDDILYTNAGPALKITYNGIIPNIYNISEDSVADALVSGSPGISTKKVIIKNIKTKNISALSEELKTPWLHVKRVCNINKNNDVQIDDTVTLYKNLIPSEDFKKPEFIKLKKWLKNNFKDVIIVFESK